MVIAESTFLALILLLIVERMFELIISWRNARRALARGGIEVGRAHYRVLVAMHTAFIASCIVESLYRTQDENPIISMIALVATFAAQFLRYSAVITLGERWTTRIVVMPQAPPVTRGVYRWMRHPNYVAVILEIAALPMIRGCWMTAVAFSLANALMLAVRIPAEEHALGAGYAAAFAGVARFLPTGRSADDASRH